MTINPRPKCCPYDDLIAGGSEARLEKKSLVRLEGRCVMQEIGDVYTAALMYRKKACLCDKPFKIISIAVIGVMDGFKFKSAIKLCYKLINSYYRNYYRLLPMFLGVVYVHLSNPAVISGVWYSHCQLDQLFLRSSVSPNSYMPVSNL